MPSQPSTPDLFHLQQPHDRVSLWQSLKSSLLIDDRTTYKQMNSDNHTYSLRRRMCVYYTDKNDMISILIAASIL